MIDTAGPRFYITQDDHTGLLVIVTAVAVAWTVSVLVVRLLSKANLRSAVGLEELAIVVSSVRSIALRERVPSTRTND